MARFNIQNHQRLVAALVNGDCKPLPTPTIDASGCWIAPRKPRYDGYVVIKRNVQGKAYRGNLHTLSWLCANHSAVQWLTLSPSAQICHICARKACYNPAHLYLGDSSTNQIDSIRAGKHNTRKLSDDDVRRIRELIAAGVSYSALAESFGVSRPSVARIARGVAYAWLAS